MTPEEIEGLGLALKASQGEWDIIGDWTGYRVLLPDYSIEALGDDAFFIQHHNPKFVRGLYNRIKDLENKVERLNMIIRSGLDGK